MKDKTEKIIELAQEKAEKKLVTTLAAIETMKKDNEIINFASVSRKADVSRNYLYTNTRLRNLIKTLREDNATKSLEGEPKDSFIYGELLKKYNETVAENKKLKEQLKLYKKKTDI